jgi:GDP-D-mannose 3', 5'-epimerase
MKRAVVCGAGGFIGSWLVKRLKDENYYVRGVDIKYPEFSDSKADDFWLLDLRHAHCCASATKGMDEVYQLAAWMGGAGFIFTGKNDADVMYNSGLINLNMCRACVDNKVKKIFYSSSACIYPEFLQEDVDSVSLKETDAYPAGPDSEYGWEKLFSERLYLSFLRNYGLNVFIGRFHNIYGPESSFDNGKEKAPSALCRKVALCPPKGTIELWGDGNQKRSFCYIDDCTEAVIRLMNTNHHEPINIGSEESVTINDLADKIAVVANKEIYLKHIDGPQGVRGRNSDNTKLREVLQWEPSIKLSEGLIPTYNWIANQLSCRAVVRA